MRRVPATILVFLVLGSAARAENDLIVNGGFEQGSSGWGKFWSRTGDGQAEVVTDVVHERPAGRPHPVPGRTGLELPASRTAQSPSRATSSN